MALATTQFSRNTKLYLEEIGGEGNIWEIPVLDGFSLSQATNATDIALNEMTSSTGVSRRGTKKFNDSVAPAEWSFGTYMRPTRGANAAGGTGAVEEALWANFVANGNAFTAATKEWAKAVTKTTSTIIDFNDSNTTTLGTYNLYFVLGACDSPSVNYIAATHAVTIYKIAGCVGNTASIDFDIDGIAMTTWSGFGSIITDEATFDATAAIVNEISLTDNFIRNRLTGLTLGTSAAGLMAGFLSSYDVTLTGGNITFENNITFLTPETLCTVNTPIGHVSGTRSISGNFTAYLNDTAGYSGELWEDLIAGTSVVTNVFDLSFDIGGNGNTPIVTVAMPQCHLEVPAHSIEDVISLDVAFTALGTTLDATDEATITYNMA
jgi:hypothetical protein